MAVGAGNTMLITSVLPLLIRELSFPAWTAGAIFSLIRLCLGRLQSVLGQEVQQMGQASRRSPWHGRALHRLHAVCSVSPALSGSPECHHLLAGCLCHADFSHGPCLVFSARAPTRRRRPMLQTGPRLITVQRKLPHSRRGLPSAQPWARRWPPCSSNRSAFWRPCSSSRQVRLRDRTSPSGSSCRRTAHPEREAVETNEGKGLWRSPGVLPYLVFGIGLVACLRYSDPDLSVLHARPPCMSPATCRHRVRSERKSRRAGTWYRHDAWRHGDADSPAGSHPASEDVSTGADGGRISSAGLVITSDDCPADSGCFRHGSDTPGRRAGFFTARVHIRCVTGRRRKPPGQCGWACYGSERNRLRCFSPIFGLWAYENIHHFAPFIFAAIRACRHGNLRLLQGEGGLHGPGVRN